MIIREASMKDYSTIVTFYINKNGTKVIQGFTAGGLYKGGLTPAGQGQRYGYINTSGRFVIKSKFYWLTILTANWR
ncbi:WG repeat-containing protein [Paenibacillus sp. VMFN-D1]|uniref:WG repeat-containing protein n=1 Tax=Paenibacillus sp. VMFN-D1 TaxID=2135608 RepID=UPI000E26E21C|nr:WG repeat-containing protein [Paenibacillus sp. VMFN-D1]RED41839.1 hypothetical protein C7820_3029 [Paenibacillus sp. VMFN-D1]